MDEKDELISSLQIEVENFRGMQQNLKQQLSDMQRREAALLLKLSEKENEIHFLQNQVFDLRQCLNTSTIAQTRQALLDPAVSIQFQKLKEELKQTQDKLKASQEEAEAVQFTPHSAQGKKLLAKCILLQNENLEFANQQSEGRIHELENELALQRNLNEELKKSFTESNEFVIQLDEEVEAMHNEIFMLNQKLRLLYQQQQQQQQ